MGKNKNKNKDKNKISNLTKTIFDSFFL